MLVWLTLSDYAVWSDPDLRRMVSYSAEGYVNLAALLKYSSGILNTKLEKEEVAVAKALRACPSGLALFDVRLTLPTFPSGSSATTGNYEIRRKDWGSCEESLSGYSRQYWEDASVYVENVPSTHLTLGSFAQFAASVTPTTNTDNAESGGPASFSLTNVQRVTFLPHHLDKPNDKPKPKHFAVVILASPLHSKSLQTSWPWNLSSPERGVDWAGARIEEKARTLGIKHGFRVISKTRWKQLTEEYVSQRDTVVKSLDIEKEEDAAPADLASTRTERHNVPDQPPPIEEEIQSRPETYLPANGVEHPQTRVDSPYPYHCLLFVRNVHNQTNKTTLRKLFASRLEDTGKGIDYVEYTKGTDNCYLRFLSATKAATFHRVFSDIHVYHISGLDEIGSLDKTAGCATPIQVEYVQSKKEEIYWQKVPEKVRRQAVLKAVQGGEGSSARRDDEGERPAKRRKKR